MAIQLPTIQENPQAPEQASVGRSDLKAIDTSGKDAEATNSFANLGDTIDAIQEKQAKLYANTVGSAAGVQVHQQYEDLVNQAKTQKGDPTPVYADLHDKMQSVAQAVKDQYKNASSDVQDQVSANIADVNAKFYDRISAQSTTQSMAYEGVVTNAKLETQKNDLVSNAATVKPGDESTLGGINSQLDAIETTIKNSGLKNGTVGVTPPDENGDQNYIYSPMVRARIAKEQSNAIYQAIDAANSANKPDVAAYIKDKFGDVLLSSDAIKANNLTEKTSINVASLQNVAKIKHLPYEQQMAFVDKISDPQVAEKTLADLKTHQANVDSITKGASKAVYNQLSGLIQAARDANKPFVDVNDFNNNPAVINAMKSGVPIDPKQLQALHDSITQPKVSDPKALASAQTALFSGSFQGMKAEDFAQTVSGLSKQDRAKMETIYTHLNTQTGAQQNAMYKNMGNNLENQLLATGYISKDKFGHISNDDATLLTKARNDLISASASFPPGMTYDQQNEYVKKFAADRAAGQIFKPPTAAAPVFQGTHPAAPSTTPPVPNANNKGAYAGMALQDKIKWAQKFATVNGRPANLKTTELQDFINKQGQQ